MQHQSQGSLFLFTMRKTIATLVLVLSTATLFAQGIDDAVQFSQTYYQGTAKALSMGSALGAVGGDMTAICINPAGMGIYRSDEFTTTLGFTDNYHSSKYYGERRGGNKTRMSIPNIGYVNTKERSNYRGLRFTQFSISLNRTNDFNYRTYAKGLNPTSSMVDNYLAQIDGYSEYELEEAFPFTIFPAWQTYLIDLYEDEQGLYYSSPVPQGNIWQSQEKTLRGRSEEWNFAYSANYLNRLFLGMSLNLTHIKREMDHVFEESHPEGADPASGFNRWSFTEEIDSYGWGVNTKLGLIWKANRWTRLGIAFHSPSAYGFEESWQTDTESQINRITRKYLSPQSNYEYSFYSPLKWVGSMAFVIGQRGLLSLDAEYTNYGAARFKASDYDYSSLNADIKANLGRTFNFRFGSEWYLGGSYFRFGGAYYGSPYGLNKINGSVKKASVGISLPTSETTTFDFAYELTYSKRCFDLYDAGGLGIEPVKQSQYRNLILATLKMRF